MPKETQAQPNVSISPPEISTPDVDMGNNLGSPVRISGFSTAACGNVDVHFFQGTTEIFSTTPGNQTNIPLGTGGFYDRSFEFNPTQTNVTIKVCCTTTTNCSSVGLFTLQAIESFAAKPPVLKVEAKPAAAAAPAVPGIRLIKALDTTILAECQFPRPKNRFVSCLVVLWKYDNLHKKVVETQFADTNLHSQSTTYSTRVNAVAGTRYQAVMRFFDGLGDVAYISDDLIG